MWAVIGGSGFESFEGFEVIEELDRSTPFGEASSGLKRVRINGEECLFLSRHGANHELLPSEVNFRGNIFALKKHGATQIVSFSAVGSLRAELKPGDMVVSTQYIDRTKSMRKHTFCGEGMVGHMSLAKPVCLNMVAKFKELCQNRSWDCHFEKTYVVIEGPNFSTIAESELYRHIGADIIGMTHFPEYALAREAGLHYLPCCFVTDYDCWDQSRPHVILEEVIEVMRKNNAKAFEILQDLLKTKNELVSDSNCHNEGLRSGLMTPKESLSAEQREWLKVLA